MIDKIVTIPQKDYDKLYKDAHRTNEAIEKKAIKIAKELNLYTLDIEIDGDIWEADSFRATVDIKYNGYNLPITQYREAPKEVRQIAHDTQKWINFNFKKIIGDAAKREHSNYKTMLNMLSTGVFWWRLVAIASTLTALIIALIK